MRLKTFTNKTMLKKNEFWVVYNKNMKVISLSENKRLAKQEALKTSNHRWTFQTFDRDWKYLVEDGYSVLRSVIKPL